MNLPQLPLALAPPRRPEFDNFVPGDNDIVVQTLRDGRVEGQWYFLSGPPGSGRSHLALATVASLAKAGMQVRYIPGRTPMSVALVESTSGRWVVVDDVDALAGDSTGEQALFNALNRWREERAGVIMTGADRARFALPDLRSRLALATRLVLKPLDDRALEQLVRRLLEDFHVVAGRGLVDYILRHGPRSPGQLTRLMEHMSRRALAERRVLSIPLARESLGGQSTD